MKFKNVTMGLAALSLMVAPTVASAAEAAAPQPVQEQVAGDNQFFGSHGGGVVAFLALLAILAGILAATRGNSRPNSP